MRRLGTGLTAFCMIIVWAPAAEAAEERRYRAALTSCSTGELRQERRAVFTASMRTLPHTARMSVRFDVQRRVGTSWRLAPGRPGLSRWTRASDPGAVRFAARRVVDGLAPPATYRGRVIFRWYRADGTLLDRHVQVTARCRQPERRPDLVAANLSLTRTGVPGENIIGVDVRNTGFVAAGPFTVSFGGERTYVVNELQPGSTATVSFTTTECATAEGSVAAVADPAGEVEEIREDNNGLTLACPAVTAG